MSTANRFDQETYARIKQQEILQDVRAARSGRGMGTSVLVAAGAALLVLAAVFLTRPGVAPDRASETSPAARIIRWHSPIPTLLADAILVVSVRDKCAYVAAGDFRQEFTLRLPGLTSRRPFSITACTAEMPRWSVRR